MIPHPFELHSYSESDRLTAEIETVVTEHLLGAHFIGKRGLFYDILY